MKRQFVAIRDYNPSTSSTSGRPDLEIPLTAGEMVTVVGDVDANGYYTAERTPGGKRLRVVTQEVACCHVRGCVLPRKRVRKRLRVVTQEGTQH